VRRRAEASGEGSIAIFTGNQRDFPLAAEDLGPRCEEWVGPALFWPQLRAAILDHLGGDGSEDVAVFNRASAGLVAAVSALGAGGGVVSFAHPSSGSHVSVVRGAQVGGCGFTEVGSLEALEHALRDGDVRLLVVTPVTSELDTIETAEVAQAVRRAGERGIPVLLDDAYGARLRPVVQGGPKSLELGVDLAISNSDKAGLEGPRAGFLAGRPALVQQARARAAELGQEARAPIALGVLRCLQRFSARILEEEIASGDRLADELERRLGRDRVRRTAIGPLVTEEDILSIALERAGLLPTASDLVPCEASAALGLLLLEHEGLLTVNALGQPGSRVSLRLKPTGDAIQRVGGYHAVVDAVDRSLDRLAAVIGDAAGMRTLILG
jgi:L-seryl-tRNA(Ser) seleniumtransferase